jgi:hypothetical protein
MTAARYAAETKSAIISPKPTSRTMLRSVARSAI